MYTPHQPGAYYPQIVEFKLVFRIDEERWSYQESQTLVIRFKVFGQPFGRDRWRPHLIQHKDKLPNQNNKDITGMIKTLQEALSSILELECMTVTKDLLDYIGDDI